VSDSIKEFLVLGLRFLSI